MCNTFVRVTGENRVELAVVVMRGAIGSVVDITVVADRPIS